VATGAAQKVEIRDARWQIEWVSASAGSPSVHRSEPGVGAFARLRLGLLSMIVPEDWL
jgi:hypothetical protein